MTDVASINRAQRIALLTDNRVVPITTLLDDEGDEVQSWEQANAFVAGSEATGWFCRLVADYPIRKSH